MTLIYTCPCGCGGIPTPGRTFVHGHNGRRSVRERVLSRLIIDPAGCLIWTGTTSTGYGNVHYNGAAVYVHRLMYEWFVGPIPAGKQIDHLCRTSRCAAPAHLEAVSQRVNILRGTSPTRPRMDQCQRGHDFDLLNTYWRPDRYGRQCRICNRESQRTRKATR